MGGSNDGHHHLEGMVLYDTATDKSRSPHTDMHKRVTRSMTAAAVSDSSAEKHINGDIKDGEKSVDASPIEEDKAGTRARKTVCECDGRPRDEQQSRKQQQQHSTSPWTWLGYLLLVIVSKLTLPSDLRPTSPTWSHVWYYGWVTAVSTGLGAAPLFFAQDLGKRVLSVGNAIAAGMMLSASYSLVEEGAAVQETQGVVGWWISAGVLSAPWARVALGVLAGLAFIISTKKILDEHEDLKFGQLHGIDAKKVLLIVFVMTLHSFSEGVGIGVSFGGAGGARLGFLISATLAVHNVPEGLAVALVLHPRGVSKLNTGLWCVFTSLPQPLMAVPAFLFVGQFLPFLPVGLGFAAGAMFWVACFELFVEAAEDSSKTAAFLTTASSFVTMLCVHRWLDGDL